MFVPASRAGSDGPGWVAPASAASNELIARSTVAQSRERGGD